MPHHGVSALLGETNVELTLLVQGRRVADEDLGVGKRVYLVLHRQKVAALGVQIYIVLDDVLPDVYPRILRGDVLVDYAANYLLRQRRQIESRYTLNALRSICKFLFFYVLATRRVDSDIPSLAFSYRNFS